MYKINHKITQTLFAHIYTSIANNNFRFYNCVFAVTCFLFSFIFFISTLVLWNIRFWRFSLAVVFSFVFFSLYNQMFLDPTSLSADRYRKQEKYNFHVVLWLIFVARGIMESQQSSNTELVMSSSISTLAIDVLFWN